MSACLERAPSSQTADRTCLVRDTKQSRASAEHRGLRSCQQLQHIALPTTSSSGTWCRNRFRTLDLKETCQIFHMLRIRSDVNALCCPPKDSPQDSALCARSRPQTWEHHRLERCQDHLILPQYHLLECLARFSHSLASQNHFHPKTISSKTNFIPKNDFDERTTATKSKNIVVRVCVKASPAEGRRRLHANTANARLSGFNKPRWEASPAEGGRCFT